eukprot:140245_1
MKNTKQKITPNTNEAQQLPGLNDWYFDILTKCQLPVELPSTILCVINDFCKSIVGYHYDKSEPIATIAELSLNNASFTFELWLYLLKYNTRNQNDNNIIGCARGNTNNGWLHINIRSGYPYIGFYGSDTCCKIKVPLKEWTHLAFVYDKEEKKQIIYFNGKLGTEGTNKQPLNSYPATVLCFSNYAGARVLNGVINNSRLWNCVRTEQEIQSCLAVDNDQLPESLHSRLTKLWWIDQFGTKHELTPRSKNVMTL